MGIAEHLLPKVGMEWGGLSTRGTKSLMRVRLALALALAVGLAAPVARAQESVLDARRAAARATPSDAGASLQYGVALRRAGRDAEAAQELRRGAALPSGGQGDAGIMLRFELARTA